MSVAVAGAVLVGAAARAQLPTAGASRNRAEQESPEARRSDSLAEARLDVELLQLELSGTKQALTQHLQMLNQYEVGRMFGPMGMGGMGMGRAGGPGGGAPDSEQYKKAKAEVRERFEELKSATVQTSRKLAEARRRLAELEGTAGQAATADNPPRDDRSTVAERRAHLALLELEYDVDKALLREAMAKLGQVELQQTLYPVKGDGGEDAEKGLDRMRDYVDMRKNGLIKRGIELNLKKQELAEIEERIKER
jgi:hypothetical protein